MRDDGPITELFRSGPGRPFTLSEIQVVETFAGQAVIAIEDARLFAALQEANSQLEEASRYKSQPVVGAQNSAGNQAARSWRCGRPATTVRTRIGPMVPRRADR